MKIDWHGRALVLGLLLLFPMRMALAAGRQVLHGHVPAVVDRLAPTGRLDQTKRLKLAIALPPRHPEELTKLLHDLYDPKSPRYRRFLKPTEYAEQFGPSTEDYEALSAFAKANGFNVTHTHANRLLLDVEGAVADVEKTFHVTMRTYQHPTEARQFFSADVEPSIDAPVTILEISGLSNYALPHPNLKHKPDGVQTKAKGGARAKPLTGAGPQGNYAGNDFRAAYVPGTALTGTGQSVGLLEFDGYYAADITAYETQFNLPSVPLVNVPIDGGVPIVGGGVDEVSLDIEMVLSMSPGVKTIYVYESSGSWLDMLNQMANDDFSNQLSCSWGGGSASPAAEAIFQQMALQGQSFFAASGDSCAYTGQIPFPSDSPSITTVGGTTLTTAGPGGAYVSEKVWNWGGGEGSSGGVSTTYSIPTYQNGISMTLNQGSTTMRNVPDVALTADNVWVIYDNGFSGSFGGTSCAAPLWAAFTALVNQQAAANGQPPVGFLNPTLYSLAAGNTYNANLSDITTGNNFSPESPTKYSAVTGYDLATGLGTPIGAMLLPNLGGPFIPTITGFSPANGAPNSSVIITGTNFYGITNVSFNGLGAAFTVNSPTQITATVPVGAVNGPISVATPGGTATSATNFVVFGYTPGFGLPGATVTLSGTGFTGATAVTFNGITTPFTVNSDTQITTSVPVGATTGSISVTTPGGTITSSGGFIVLTGDGTPSIASFTPSSGSVGSSVIITGANLVSLTSVTFNGIAAASYTVNSQNQITATVPVPVGSVTGPISVTTTLGGATSANAFTTLATLANYSSATDVPLTSNGFTATGHSVYFTLNYAPAPGTNLTVVNNTGLGFINGTFSNLAQGQQVALTFGGITYNFVANYYGGTGNDLVLQWAASRPLAWGLNGSGQLGDNSTANSSVPAPVTTTGLLYGKTIIAISSGQNHSLALCSDGTVAAWGDNSHGQLGNANVSNSAVPVAVDATSDSALFGKTVVAVAAGAQHSLALCSDGTVAAWGANGQGQLGVNNTFDSYVPVAVVTTSALSGKSVVALAAGQFHSLALCSDGTVVAWGGNVDGQLGNGGNVQSSIPVAVDAAAGSALLGETVVAIAAGYDHNVVLCADGNVAAWGLNADGELGNGGSTNSNVPVAVTTTGTPLAGKMVTAVAAGFDHTLALCSDGTLADWGANALGQLGAGNTNASNVPVAVDIGADSAFFGKTVAAISAGYQHSVGLCTDGTVALWGSNNDGQLGNNSTGNSLVPVAPTVSLTAGETFIQVISGNSSMHSLALVAEPPAPQMIVQQPVGTSLNSGSSSVNFGSSAQGVGVPLTFTIFNNGTAPLLISSATIDGANSSDFSITTPPASTVAVGASTALVVTFTPSAPINRSAALHVLSNDPNDGAFNVGLFGSTPGTLAATFNAPTDVPLTTGGFTASGSTVNFALNFAPLTGTNLTVVNNTGLNFINGTFSNLSQGQVVTMGFGSTLYTFVANYYGGTGNDLVLQWASQRPVAWGQDLDGELGDNSPTSFAAPVAVLNTGVLAGKTVIAVSCGYQHALALCSDGTVAAWGYNGDGQLGNNSYNNSPVPVAVDATSDSALFGKTVTAISAGQYHNLALCSDGTLVAWGYNGDGELGNNDNESFESLIPVLVNVGPGSALAGKTVTAISAGGYHSLALCSDGTVAAWGANFEGQLGNNTQTDSSIPVAVSTTGTALAGEIVTAIGAGNEHSIALCSDGTLVAWGANFFGQLGNNTFNDSSVAVAVITAGTPLAGKTVTAIAAGQDHNLALSSDGSVAAWGYDGDGELGNANDSDSPVPVAVNTSTALSGKTVTAIAAGQYHSLARCSDGTVAAWGSNSYGQLGDSSTVASNTPVAVITTGTPLAGKTPTLISAGGDFSVASCSDSTLTAWGNDLEGQLGNNNPTSSSVPVSVSVTPGSALAGKTILSEAAGQQHSLALCSDGTIAAWGFNEDGELGNGSFENSRVPVAVDETSDSALFGKTVVAVSAGGSHSLALCSDGTVAAWGANYYGELGAADGNFEDGVPVAVLTAGTPLAGRTVVSVAAGQNFSLALCSDGSLVAWGENDSGQLGNSTFTDSYVPVAVTVVGTPLQGRAVIAIAAGQNHAFALCSDGTLVGWGENLEGQLGNNSTLLSSVPVAVVTAGTPLAGKTIVSVAAGANHSVVLCSDGSLAAWGANDHGQLGNNSLVGSSVPVAVFTAGNGTVATWGENNVGQLGNGNNNDSSVPVAVSTSTLMAGEVFEMANSGACALHSLGVLGEPPQPQIAVQQPAGAGLANGTTVNFGVASVGNHISLTFSVLNTGTAPLTISGVNIDGDNASDFSVATAPASTVAAETSTTMVVNFTPAAGSSIVRSAALHLSSNDPDTGAFTVDLYGMTPGALAAVFNSATDVPLATSAFTATGSTVNFTLNYAPGPGTVFTVVKNTGFKSISGTFSNLTQSQVVTLTFGGVNYKFSANYFGGTGNDLVLQWANNRAVGWGSNSYGQLGNSATTAFFVPSAVPTAGTVLAGKIVTALVAGQQHTLALCSDGTVAAWGENNTGQLGNGSTINSSVPVLVNATGALAGKTVVALSAGYEHSLALCSDGTVVAWGYNGYGQLGNGSYTNSSVPVAVIAVGTALAGKTVTAVAAGQDHSLALCSDGTVVAWGGGSDGQLGNNSTSNSNLPVAVITAATPLSGKTVVSLAAGGFHNLALCSDHTVVAWGYNGNGQLGNGTSTNSLVPVATVTSGVLAGKTVTALAAGEDHSMVLCSDGTVSTWGYNFYGQLGNNSTNSSTVPVAVVNSGVLAGKTVTAIAAGSYQGFVLCSNGTMASWGYNFFGQLGNNTTTTNHVPVSVTTTGTPLAGKTVKKLSAGNSNCMALCTDGTMAGWGSNIYGQLGNGISIQTNVPAPVTVAGTSFIAKTVMALGVGNSHSLALCSSGAMFAWGQNDRGQLGTDNLTNSSVPVPVVTAGTPLTSKTVVAIATGTAHNLALCSNGTVASWGYNVDGQLGNNSTSNSTLAVAVVTTGVLAGKTVVAVAAGNNHSLALCSDGTLAAWGYNSEGQLGNGTTTNSLVPIAVTTAGTPLAGRTVIAIAAGGLHSLALCSDGTLVGWGDSLNGQLGNGSIGTNLLPTVVTTAGTPLAGKTIVGLAGGQYHTVALCSDGTVVAVGDNIEGQLGDNSTTQTELAVPMITNGALSGKLPTAIAAGNYHSLMLCSDGTLTATGYARDGELGNNDTAQSNVPVTASMAALAQGETFMQAASGPNAFHSLGVIAEPAFPAVLTLAATSITTSGATLNASLNPDNNSTTGNFQYGLSTAYGKSTSTQSIGSGGTFAGMTAVITGLTGHTTYHFQAQASNAAGASTGADLTFTTLDNNPVANADTANNIGGPTAIAVLSNDTDADGDTLTITGVTQGTSGAVTNNGTTVTYTPGPNFSSSDTFSYSISDGFGGTATANVTVNAAPVQSWRVQTFGANSNNPAIAGDNADPNNNGIPNLMEYALHGDALGNTTGTGILPQVSDSAGGELQIAFTRYLDRTDITLIVQACDSLTGPWTNLAQSADGAAFTVMTTGATINETGSGNSRSVTVGDIYQMNDPAHPHRFMRLMVTRP